MNGEDLLEALGEINPRYINEAETKSMSAKPPAWKRYAALAACLVVILGAVRTLDLRTETDTLAIDPEKVYFNEVTVTEESLLYDHVPGKHDVTLGNEDYQQHLSGNSGFWYRYVNLPILPTWHGENRSILISVSPNDGADTKLFCFSYGPRGIGVSASREEKPDKTDGIVYVFDEGKRQVTDVGGLPVTIGCYAKEGAPTTPIYTAEFETNKGKYAVVTRDLTEEKFAVVGTYVIRDALQEP